MGTAVLWRWERTRCHPKLSPELQPGQASVTRTVLLQPGSKALGYSALCWALLGVEMSQVMVKLVTAGETLVKPLSRQQELDSWDALAKHMEDRSGAGW